MAHSCGQPCTLSPSLLPSHFRPQPPACSQASTADRHTPDILFQLLAHLSHHLNLNVVPDLLTFARATSPSRSAGLLRLLRLLTPALFRPALYASHRRIARGAFATVYRCQMPDVGGPTRVAVKSIDLPATSSERSTIVDVFEEVSILDALSGSPWCCGLLDYGVGTGHIFLVLKDYPTSLREWRAGLPPGAEAGPVAMQAFLAVFAAVLEAVSEMISRRVVHYDIKCDNILLEPLSTPLATHGGDWDPDRPPFRVVLADFGESRMFKVPL